MSNISFSFHGRKFLRIWVRAGICKVGVFFIKNIFLLYYLSELEYLKHDIGIPCF